MSFSQYRRSHFLLFLIFLLLATNEIIFGQQQRPKSKPATTRRISFAEAQKLLANENEGNLSRQPKMFSRTRLSTGQVLEVYYPITASSRSGKPKPVMVAGYGVLYESEAAFKDAARPRHMLEELIPDGRDLVANVPQLSARLEKRLRLGRGRLDYSRASLKRVDAYIVSYQSSHTTAQTDPILFQELTAYYGETLRRAVNGAWLVRNERIGDTQSHSEPNIAFSSGGRNKEIKPWSSVISALYDEDKRGIGLTKVFDADINAAK